MESPEILEHVPHDCQFWWASKDRLRRERIVCVIVRRCAAAFPPFAHDLELPDLLAAEHLMAMSVRLFERDQLPRAPWKNGGGLTREIVRIPVESRMDDFSWRASIAELSAGGPFSTFDGVDRVLVLLSGAGVHLRSSDGAVDHRLDTPLVPFAFAGETAISASLLGGASSDFNVMTRRDSTSADVRIIRAVERLGASRAGVLFAAQGAWSVRSREATYSLAEGGGIWWEGESWTWDVVPDHVGALIAVHVIGAASPRATILNGVADHPS